MNAGSPQPRQSKTSPRFPRRGFIVGGVFVLGSVGAARWFNIGARIDDQSLSAVDALAAVQAGEITLIDIRRPDEWVSTGVAQGAITIDMRRDDFVTALLAEPGITKDDPIALICARGVRSRRLTDRLTEAGFTKIIDVPEGMLGSGAGPGWLKRGLPVKQP